MVLHVLPWAEAIHDRVVWIETGAILLLLVLFVSVAMFAHVAERELRRQERLLNRVLKVQRIGADTRRRMSDVGRR